MNLAAMIELARLTLRDNKTPPLWSDDELISYVNDGQREACRRARLIVDSTTDEITLIALQTGESSYPLDDRILFIRRAKLAGRSEVLHRKSFQDLDIEAPDWEGETGEPRLFVPDMDENVFRPYPTPEDDGEVRLTVVRLPLADMAQDNDEPEIKPRYHDSMMNWVYYRAYSKQDADTKDDAKAAAYLTMFENEFGKKSSAIDEVWIAREHGFDGYEGGF